MEIHSEISLLVFNMLQLYFLSLLLLYVSMQCLVWPLVTMVAIVSAVRSGFHSKYLSRHVSQSNFNELFQSCCLDFESMSRTRRWGCTGGPKWEQNSCTRMIDSPLSLAFLKVYKAPMTGHRNPIHVAATAAESLCHLSSLCFWRLLLENESIIGNGWLTEWMVSSATGTNSPGSGVKTLPLIVLVSSLTFPVFPSFFLARFFPW